MIHEVNETAIVKVGLQKGGGYLEYPQGKISSGGDLLGYLKNLSHKGIY